MNLHHNGLRFAPVVLPFILHHIRQLQPPTGTKQILNVDFGWPLAPLLIPGDGMEIFAGKLFQKGDALLQDNVVLMIDLDPHHCCRAMETTFLWMN